MSTAELLDLAFAVVVYLAVATGIMLFCGAFAFLYSAIRYSARDFIDSIKGKSNGNPQDDSEF